MVDVYYIEDDVIYGLTHVNGLDGQFGATPFYMKGDFPEFEETVILDENGRVLSVKERRLKNTNNFENYLTFPLGQSIKSV